jgi:Holliday junction resolvase
MTPRLPSLRARDVIRALERAGFAVSRTSIAGYKACLPITAPVNRADAAISGTEIKDYEISV